VNDKNWNLVFICWIVALVATTGSLFFSEVMHFRPCSMCWYQRIAMYPLVLLFLPSLFKFDKDLLKYTLPLTVIGWFWAFYHNLLHWDIIPKSAAPCVRGVPCSTVYIRWGGFITIPLLSLIAFTIILILSYFLYRGLNREQ